MLHRWGDLFAQLGRADAICITTNGVLRRNGRAVCGRGVALAARERWPVFETVLGDLLAANGNRVQPVLVDGATTVLAFPTKHDWRMPSTMELIVRSCGELVSLIDSMGWRRVALPEPGCSSGGLSWARVGPVVGAILDSRCEVMHRIG